MYAYLFRSFPDPNYDVDVLSVANDARAGMIRASLEQELLGINFTWNYTATTTTTKLCDAVLEQKVMERYYPRSRTGMVKENWVWL